MLRTLGYIGISIFLAGGALADTRYVTSTGGAAMVDGPWVESRSVGSLGFGAKVSVSETYQGYALVRTGSGAPAWVKASALGTKPKPAVVAKATARPAEAEKVKPYSSVVWTKAGPLNMRSGPGTSHAVTGKCQRGDWVKVVAKAGIWAEVTLTDGKTGWVHTAYLTR